jgi:2-amino-4-hydroxy-6-hydroxymethyldihydropteridine diphosphokinase
MRKPAVRVWVALGSNRGDRRANVEGAVEALRRSPGITVWRVSPWFETEPVGGPPGQERFLNGVLEADCELEPRELLALLHAIETSFGRRRADEPRHGPRTLDLDLLFYGEERIAEEGLVVPHPRLEERVFVLEPLGALAPERRLPSGKSVRERLRELEGVRGQDRPR